MTKEELFNLRHAQLCNVIECIFGVLKQKFQILLLAPEYNLDIQARLPAALCAIHNFTREHDPEVTASDDDGTNIDHEFYHRGGGYEMEGLGADNAEAAAMRDEIANNMWVDYQSYIEGGNSDDEEYDDSNDKEYEDAEEGEDEDE